MFRTSCPIHALTIEIYKTLNDLNPVFMKEIFCLKQYNYHMRNKSLDYQNPRTVTYGLETFMEFYSSRNPGS